MWTCDFLDEHGTILGFGKGKVARHLQGHAHIVFQGDVETSGELCFIDIFCEGFWVMRAKTEGTVHVCPGNNLNVYQNIMGEGVNNGRPD